MPLASSNLRIGEQGMQTVGRRGELAHAGGVGGIAEADADPVRAQADVDAGGMRVRHGQRIDPAAVRLLARGRFGGRLGLAFPIALLGACPLAVGRG